MKAFLSVILTFVSGFSLSADSLRLAGIVYQSPTNIEITWSAPTNALPHGLWVYKVIPQDFSMAVISNALAICSLQIRNIVNPHDTNQIQFRDKRDIGKSRRFLRINSFLGEIEYHNNWYSKEPAEDVPDDKEAAKLAMDYFFQLGIDRSQFINTPSINPTTRITWHQGRELPEEITQREVVLHRRIDGVELSGGSSRITFGSHSRIEAFDLSWRNLLPYESHPLANTNEIIGFIRNGQAVIPMPEFNFRQLNQAKKLIVTKITPYYWGEWPSDQQDFVYPFAQLEMTADLGNTNFNFQLRCPILSTNNNCLNSSI